MSLKSPKQRDSSQRILGRVRREDFVGRSDELNELVHVASNTDGAQGLLFLLAPTAGVSELFRQAYDELFNLGDGTIPIHFAASWNADSVETAWSFLQTFLQQLVAFRRRDASLVNASLTMRDLIDLAAPADEDWLARLASLCELEREGSDTQSFIKLCLSVPQRANMQGLRPFVMFDALQLSENGGQELLIGTEVAEAFLRSPMPFALAGRRRGILDIVDGVSHDPGRVSIRRLEQLENKDARALCEQIAASRGVRINDQTRDLIIQQFSASPFFINSFVQSAADREAQLTSFVICQQLYVDEMMGGRISRHFDAILDRAAPSIAVRRNVTRVLYESSTDNDARSPVATWRRRLGLEETQFQHVMRMLHSQELVSFNANYVKVEQNPPVWRDYLKARYRLEIAAEPRALVVADTLIATLKRAPQTMARHYRREAALGVSDLIKRFNCQRVPASLLHYERFSASYKGAPVDEIGAGLDAETDLIRLPQVVHVSTCSSFNSDVQLMCDEERCAVAHGFDAGTYTEGNEVVWIVAEIESKLEAGRGITEIWVNRLIGLARASSFKRVHLWLVAPEGFSPEATDLMTEKSVYSSSRLQMELLGSRLTSESLPGVSSEGGPDEFEMVIPMGDDSELIAADTVERIARKINFQPEAINQIKTALIEACINATEHSLSPDRKIYQRYQLRDDRLVITVSSRGVVATSLAEQDGNEISQGAGLNDEGAAQDRRGWGLRLIKTLMDEVEFQRVDDGTCLKMTKYLRK